MFSQLQGGKEVTDSKNYAWRNYGSLVLVITLGVCIVLLLVSTAHLNELENELVLTIL